MYWYLANQETSCDEETWAIALLELQDKGFNPNCIIADDGSSLRSGHEMVMPDVPCHGNIFHITKKLMDVRRFFRNCLKSAITERIEIEDKILRAEIAGKDHNYYTVHHVAIESEHRKRHLSETVDTMVSWLQHNVFEKAGSPLEERQYLHDFIVEERAHRIRAIRVALQNQRDQLLAFVGAIGEKFSQLSKTHKIDIDIIWKMCELLRCKIGGDNYGMRSLPLQEALGDQYDEIEDSSH